MYTTILNIFMNKSPSKPGTGRSLPGYFVHNAVAVAKFAECIAVGSQFGHENVFDGSFQAAFGESLNLNTSSLAIGCHAVSLFVNDDASAPVLDSLNKLGVEFIALRSAGFNHVALSTHKSLESG